MLYKCGCVNMNLNANLENVLNAETNTDIMMTSLGKKG